MNKLENILCNRFARKFCLVTGNGTTAMYIYFKTKDFNNYIVFPSITCRLAVNAALLSNKKIIFCDINLDNYTLCPKSLKKIIKNYKVDCVVPTHTFGYLSDLNAIEKICKKNKIKILEDAAQSMGAKYRNKITGSFGDSSIISFGYSKLLDCGGGGAILTDSKNDFLKMKIELSKLKKRNKNYFSIFEQYKDLYYSLNSSNNKFYKELIIDIELFFTKYFIFKIDKKYLKLIKDKLVLLDLEIKNRNLKASLYKKNLNKKYFLSPKVFQGSVFWRYTTITKKDRDKLITHLRNKKIDVSSWYPPLHNIYANQKLKNSDYISNKIINFWVNKEHSKYKINKTLNVINSYLRK